MTIDKKYLAGLAIALAFAGGLTLGHATQANSADASKTTGADKGADIGSLSEEQKQEINGLIEAYIMEHPELILQSVANLRDRNERAEEERVAQALKDRSEEVFNSPTDVSVGNLNGDVILVEFFDYNCGYCKQNFKSLLNLIEGDGNLKVTFKEFPILSEDSNVAARAALAAAKQDKYWELHKALMLSKGRVTEKLVYDTAKGIGLNVDLLKRDMASAEITAILDKNYNLAKDLGIDGTPAFVIDDMVIAGMVQGDGLQQLISTVRKKREES